MSPVVLQIIISPKISRSRDPEQLDTDFKRLDGIGYAHEHLHCGFINGSSGSMKVRCVVLTFKLSGCCYFCGCAAAAGRAATLFVGHDFLPLFSLPFNKPFSLSVASPFHFHSSVIQRHNNL